MEVLSIRYKNKIFFPGHLRSLSLLHLQVLMPIQLMHFYGRMVLPLPVLIMFSIWDLVVSQDIKDKTNPGLGIEDNDISLITAMVKI